MSEQIETPVVELPVVTDAPLANVEVPSTEIAEPAKEPSGLELGFKRIKRENQAMKAELEAMKSYVSQMAQPKEPTVALEDMDEAQRIQYGVQKALADMQAQQAQVSAQQAQQHAMMAKLEEFKAFTPDLMEVLKDAEDLMLPNEAQQFIRGSEVGALIAYKLEKDENLYESIIALRHNPRAMQKALDKLEDSLEAEVKARKVPKSAIPAPVGSPIPQGGKAKVEAQSIPTNRKEFQAWKDAGGLKTLKLSR